MDQAGTSLISVPAEAGARAAAAEEQDDNNDDCHDRESDVHDGDRVANVVGVAVGGAVDTLLLHVVEAEPGPARIRQAPST